MESGEKVGEECRRNPEVIGAQRSKPWSGWKEDCQQLLPGIPQQITLNLIAPKLPWTAFHALSLVSRGWREAIQSRQVHQARVFSHSTETFVAISHLAGDVHAISLYSLRDKSVRQLPGIPQLQGRVPRACQGVTLDGKLYVLGGVKDSRYTATEEYIRALAGSEEVYVMDLAGQGQWKQCASMQEGRLSFGCGVLDEKIYVFGGTSNMNLVCGCELYDPALNAWSSIPSLEYIDDVRFEHRVALIGEEFYLYGGLKFDENYFDGKEWGLFNDGILVRRWKIEFASH